MNSQLETLYREMASTLAELTAIRMGQAIYHLPRAWHALWRMGKVAKQLRRLT